MKKELLDALVQEKRIGNLLNEILDTSRQLAEALDRNDQVSAQMIIAMRAEPIEKLQVADNALRMQIAEAQDQVTARRIAAILNGAAAQDDEEEMLEKQVDSNKRVMEKVAQLDRILNKKIARDKSVYK